jgi:hypothetical protein
MFRLDACQLIHCSDDGKVRYRSVAVGDRLCAVLLDGHTLVSAVCLSGCDVWSLSSMYILCLRDATCSGTEIPHCLPFTMNAAVDWIVLPLAIRHVPCSNLGPKTSFCSFPSVPPGRFPDIASNYVTSVFCHVVYSALMIPP